MGFQTASEELNEAVGDDKTLENYIAAHLGRIERDDYFGLRAYVEMNDANQQSLDAIRRMVLENFKIATY